MLIHFDFNQPCFGFIFVVVGRQGHECIIYLINLYCNCF